MIKLGTNSIGKVYLGADKIGKAYLGSNLVYDNNSGPTPPLPYTPVEYIVTDGQCRISTGLVGTPPRSSEIKVMMGDNTSCGLLAAFIIASGGDSKTFGLARYYSSYKAVGLSYYTNYAGGDGMPSVEWSVDNNKPFIVKTSLVKNSQSISVKQENSDSWTTANKTNSSNVSSTYAIQILNEYRAGGFNGPAPSGTRLYYCKIYDDTSFTNLIFDGIPCLYQGEYGLWDRVSDSFKGNSNSSGTFSGPSN